MAEPLDHLHRAERRHPHLNALAGSLFLEQLQQIPHRHRRLVSCRGITQGRTHGDTAVFRLNFSGHLSILAAGTLKG